MAVRFHQDVFYARVNCRFFQTSADGHALERRANLPGYRASRAEAESTYVEVAVPVLKALSDGAHLAEGELFKRIDASDFRRFRLALNEMRARGLVRVATDADPWKRSDIYTRIGM
jgi:hypothetical protein